MKNTLSISDSLIGSLCRELDFIRNRYRSINLSLTYCRDKYLKRRLFKELEVLEARKDELSSISSLFSESKESVDLSSLFLIELCKRSL